MLAGLYDTENRELPPNQGRWISPDPAGLAAADPTNPQSWNRYAYVMNSPLGLVDPSGLWCVWDDGYDPDPGDGGVDPEGCAAQGGYWDPTDTVTSCNSDTGACTGGGSICGDQVCFGTYTFQSTSTANDDTGWTLFWSDASGFFTNLNACVVKNAKNYSLGGVANLIANTQIPGSSLASNSITDAYTLFTGQDGLLSSAWNATKTGFRWAAAASPRTMTNGPNSFTTISPVRGSPQAILGNGTNYQGLWASLKRAAKAGAELKLAVDAGLTGALVLNCSLGQIQ